MNQESLEKAKELLTDIIGNSDINEIDKVELLINLYAFLNKTNYELNIKTLQKELERRKYDSNNQGRKR